MARGRRRGFRIGDHLVVDDESGFVEYASNIKECWDGTLRRSNQYEARHPQEFVRPKGDPYPVYPIRTEPMPELENNTIPLSVGNTNIPTAVGAASHIYRIVINDQYLIGIGEMIIDDPGVSGFVVG